VVEGDYAYTPGIFHTDSKFLRVEHIDEEKAVSLMKAVKQLQAE
jgi:hypothetical protein